MLLDTKCESYTKVKEDKIQEKRYNLILNVLNDNNELTAREICRKLHKTDMNFVRPRISELLRNNVIEEAGTKFDKTTNRNVHIFRIRKSVQ